MANNTIQQVSQDKLTPFRQLFAKAEASFRAALPSTVAKTLTPERLTKITLAAISRNPLLLQCSPESILRAVMDAASLGLEPTGGVLGHGYLVPYRNGKTGNYEAQFIPGYRGLISLARRSADVDDIEARVVHAKDRFRNIQGTVSTLEHEPSLDAEPGDIVAVYALAWLKGSSRPHVEVMTKAEVDRIRNRSRARDSGPWVTDYDEMARKTVVRRIAKYLPMSTEIVRALEIEDAAEDGNTFDGGSLFELPAHEEEAKPQTAKIVDKIKRNKGAAKEHQQEQEPKDEVLSNETPAPESDDEATAHDSTFDMPEWDKRAPGQDG